MKKIITIALIAISVFSLTACTKTDSIKFKEDYEKLNNQIREKDNRKIRSITIDKNNPFVYKSEEDIIKAIKNKETFLVYFGFNDCPWCRSILPTLIDVAKNYKIKQIYYVDVKNIRDTLILNDNNEVEVKTRGTNGYYELLNLLSDVLNDYTLTSNNNEQINTNEKRIYAPNIIAIQKGKPVKLESGISDLQTDGYARITNEIENDMYKKLESVVKLIK